MCRFIAMAGERFDPNERLAAFARLCEQSKEYQGHGWGCAWLENGSWREHHSITPIWDDELPSVPATSRFVAHARSAFRNEGITVENTMPFSDGNQMFVFNGELRGVRIRSEGRIGAEKIFRYATRFSSNTLASVRQAVPIIEKRSEYVRAMNFAIADTEGIIIVSHYNEDPDYFTLHRKSDEDATIVSSMPLDERGWTPIPNKTIEVIA